MYDSRQDASGPTARDWQIAAANRFPDQRLIERRRFVMQDDLVALVQNGRKRTTIRFDEHGLEYPASRVLPTYAVGGNQPHHEAAPAGEVVRTGLRYVRCGDLSSADAKADGFKDRQELIDALTRFYPSITPSSLVCIYAFAPVVSESETGAAANRRSGRSATASALAAAV